LKFESETFDKILSGEARIYVTRTSKADILLS